jgi:hypothetical protein
MVIGMLSLFAFLAGAQLATLFTLWLAAGALGLAIVAVTISLQPQGAENLDELHRAIDLVRAKFREADGDTRQSDALRRELQALMARLPKDDLRRRPIAPRRRLG